MKRPERLLFCKQWNDMPRSEDTNIEAVFFDLGQPILFRAKLPFEEREFYADIFSTNEGSANFFSPEELLEACFCSGALKEEHTELTDEVTALMEKCDTPCDDNNLD